MVQAGWSVYLSRMAAPFLLAPIQQLPQPTTLNMASPHLDTLLSKLRPFQRSAFEFAVHGTIPSDEKQSSNKKAAYHERGKYYGAPQQQNNVAGAGTGRILLGDEMGLG